MGRRKSCGPGMREVIFRLRQQEKSYDDIAKELECSKKMVYGAIKHVEKHGTFENIPRKKRPRKKTKRIDRNIVKLSKQDPKRSAPDIHREITADTDVSISVRTVRRRLAEAGLHGRIPRKKPLVGPKTRKSRTAFAKSHMTWSENNWKYILWSDETKINRLGPDGRRHVRRPKGAALDPKYTTPVVKHGGGSINIWGCFSWNGVGPIHRINGILTAEKYIEILRTVMLPWADENLPVVWKFQQDNDPKHTARVTKRFFEENYIDILEWPSSSPDLNPIEHLWGKVKKDIAGRNFSNTDELFEAVQQAWNAIPIEYCRKLIRSMKSRCEAVIRNKGYPTKY